MTTDLEKLQGGWDIVDLVLGGQKMPTAGSFVSIQGDRFTTEGLGIAYGGRLELDARQKPKAFDLRFDQGPEAGNTALGIYDLHGTTWKICFTTDNKSKRPSAFVSPAASTIALETLHRQTTEKLPNRRQAAEIKPAAEHRPTSGVDVEAKTILEGEWAMVAMSMNGIPLDAIMIRQGRRFCRGNHVKALMGRATILDARFSLDESQTPAAINYHHLAGQNRHHTQLGIFELKGDRLRLSIGARGGERPTDFNSVAGDGRTITEWRRLAPGESADV